MVLPHDKGLPEGAARPALPRWSVRASLACLVLACLLPGLVGAVLLLAYQYREDRTQLERHTVHTARALVQAMDADLLKAVVMLESLATDESLARGDLVRFRQRARDVQERTWIGSTIILADRDGNQVLNLLPEAGQGLPRSPQPETARGALAWGRPAFSGVVAGPEPGRRMIVVSVPATVAGKGGHVLSAGIPAEHFIDIFLTQDFPVDWVGTVFDGAGAVIARTRGQEEFVGKTAPREYLELFRQAGEGAVEALALDGIPILLTYSRSTQADWTVAIGIPRWSLYTDLERTLAIFAAGVVGLFGLGLGLAWLLGERIARSVKAITREAAGGISQPQAFHIREAAEAAALLREGSRALEEANRSLRAKESELREAQRVGRFGYWYRNLETGEIRISESMQELVGRPTLPPYLEQRGTFLSEASWERVNAAVQETLRTGTGYDIELQAFRGDGSPIWINARGEAVRDPSGKIVALRGTAQDITARKLAEEALRESETRFRDTFEQAAVGIAHIAPDGRWLRVNDRLCAIVGYDREALLNLTFQDITYPHDLDGNLEQLQKLISGQIPSYTAEKRYVRLGGATVWVQVTAALVRKPTGEPDYAIAVVEDIQRRKETEAALASNQRLLAERSAVLEATNRELQAANQQLEGFIYAASHDLKGPLGRMSSFSTLLERNYRDRLEGDGLRFLDFIRDNALRLTFLVDDLLSHARAVQLASQLQPIDLRQAFQAVLAERAEDIREAGTVVRMDLPAIRVLANPFALQQVIGNLLENSLKFSGKNDRPAIEIGGEAVGERFRLWFRDNGIGFDMAYHDRIFEIFRRLHTYDEYAGSGVGLALVKRAMERMGGKVWAESVPGEGATFYLELGIAEEVAPAALP